MTSRGTRPLSSTSTPDRAGGTTLLKLHINFLTNIRVTPPRVYCECHPPESMRFFFSFLIGFTKIGTKPRYRVSTTRTALSHLSRFGKSAYWFTRHVLPGAPLSILRLFRGLFSYPLHRGTGDLPSLKRPHRPPKLFDCLVPHTPVFLSLEAFRRRSYRAC